MRVLTKDDFLKDELKTEKVELPEKDGFVFVTELCADARDEFDQYCFAQKKAKKDYVHVRAALVALSTVNEKGERLFSFEDIVDLGKKGSGLLLDKIFNVSNRLNKIFDSEAEEIAKNSETPQGDNAGGE